MLRALFGLVLRQLTAVAVGLAMFSLGTALAIDTALDPDSPFSGAELFVGGIRWSILLTATTLLVLEGPRLKGQILQRSRAIAEATGQAPRRADRALETLPGWLLVTAILVVIYAIRFVWTCGDCGVLLEFAFSWLALRATLWLVVGRWTSWRLGWRSRGLASPPRVAPAFPLLVAAQVSVCLLLLWVRLPHLVWVNLLLEANGTDSTQEMIVELGPDDSIEEIRPKLLEYHATAKPVTLAAPRHSAASRSWVIRAPTVVLLPLVFELAADDENVVDLEPNPRLAASDIVTRGPCPEPWLPGVTNDPLSAGQVALSESGADAVLLRRSENPSTRHRRSLHVRPVKVAVIDQHVDRTHEDLRGIVAGESGPPGEHGTAVAGIAAAISGNNLGLASLNTQGRRIQVLDYPAFDDPDPGPDDVVDAIYKAVADDADVILMAFAGPDEAPYFVAAALDDAADNGIILVAAAGNTAGSSSDDHWPANHPDVIAVPATAGSGLAPRSSRAGSGLTLAAPGMGICGPTRGEGYRLFNGSSMAAAVVAGALADRAAECPYDNHEEVVVAALQSAQFLDPASGPRLDVDALDRAPCARVRSW